MLLLLLLPLLSLLLLLLLLRLKLLLRWFVSDDGEREPAPDVGVEGTYPEAASERARERERTKYLSVGPLRQCAVSCQCVLVISRDIIF